MAFRKHLSLQSPYCKTFGFNSPSSWQTTPSWCATGNTHHHHLPLISCLGVWRKSSLNSAHWTAPVTLMVRSPEADTIYLSSKSTTFTAALCPTRTRRRLMSVGEAMSQTAIDLSLEQVTIKPLAKRRWRTASLWWMSVLRTSPVVTSHTLGGSTGKWPLPHMKVWIKYEGRIQRQRRSKGVKRAMWHVAEVES